MNQLPDKSRLNRENKCLLRPSQSLFNYASFPGPLVNFSLALHWSTREPRGESLTGWAGQSQSKDVFRWIGRDMCPGQSRTGNSITLGSTTVKLARPWLFTNPFSYTDANYFYHSIYIYVTLTIASFFILALKALKENAS